MLSPKEKAEELFSTYRFALSVPNAPLGENKDNIAKQCALIAVDEIIDKDGYNNDYWQEVKQEINKL